MAPKTVTFICWLNDLLLINAMVNSCWLSTSFLLFVKSVAQCGWLSVLSAADGTRGVNTAGGLFGFLVNTVTDGGWH